MTVSSEGNKISIIGTFDEYNFYAMLGAMHNRVNSAGYQSIDLDFSDCNKAYSAQMLSFVARCQRYWSEGIDIYLTLPSEKK